MLNQKTEPKLREYQDLLLKWNKSINLISKPSELEIWERHILDCAQVFEYLEPDDSICDIGSGAGLPGIILSIMGIKNTVLIESDTRKCAFLRQASQISENKITILNERIENCKIDQIDYITSRALGSVSNLLSYNENIQPSKGFILLKGKNYQKELEEASKTWHFESKAHTSKTDLEAVILEIKNVIQKN